MYGVDLSGSGLGAMTRSCKHGDEQKAGISLIISATLSFLRRFVLHGTTYKNLFPNTLYYTFND